MKMNGQIGDSAGDIIRHSGEGSGTVRQDIEFSHSHRSGRSACSDETLGKLAWKALVGVGQRPGFVVSQQVKATERVHEGIRSHATERAASLDKEGLRASPRG